MAEPGAHAAVRGPHQAGHATHTDAETTARCLDCRRQIRSAESLAAGRGAGCRAKLRKATRTADLSAWTPSQIKEAEQAVEDGAFVASNRAGVYHVVSTDGSEVHLVHRDGCNCISGLKTLPPRPCWHRCLVAIVTAPAAPTPRPVPAPVAVAPPAPVTAPAGDIWTELDRLTDAFMAVG
jgi:hypothetical protein